VNLSDGIQQTPLDFMPDHSTLQNSPSMRTNLKPVTTKIINADCALALKALAEGSIDLIMTSPPYAKQRTHDYGGVAADAYINWFLPIADELYRVLRSTGSFVLNIKEHAVKGERHTYVMELVLALRKQGWLWTEEYIWHKRNACPGKWPNRFRDAWERCIHFTKQKEFAMYQEAVMVPMGDWRKTHCKYLRKNSQEARYSKTNSGFRKKPANWIDRKMAYPDNVLYLPTECRNRGHSAVFPESLPEWFIKLFTKADNTILDPFMGSGTTLCVAKRLGRHSIGIEILPEYCHTATVRLGMTGNTLVTALSLDPQNATPITANKQCNRNRKGQARPVDTNKMKGGSVE